MNDNRRVENEDDSLALGECGYSKVISHLENKFLIIRSTMGKYVFG